MLSQKLKVHSFSILDITNNMNIVFFFLVTSSEVNENSDQIKKSKQSKDQKNSFQFTQNGLFFICQT
eukprot:TRINITY_DN2373_c1_g1_i1.p1 TRINITY_DN2373_c1_g1~~TRINITY_DN2373_c1_g1_i1.p1  ORF type:complete len:67 (+),score=13.16 TRINITY_DN2373_c1_g1_i1:62-262(+)